MSQNNNARYLIEFFSAGVPIDFNLCYRFVMSPTCGAIHTFTGSIRDTDLRRGHCEKQVAPIKGIYYEAYVSMLRKQLARIVDEVLNSESADLNARLAIGIRLGFVPVGEASIVICVSSTGRLFSQQCTMHILKEIKSSAPIWKKIIFDDGEGQWDLEEKSEAHWLRANRA